MTSELFSDSDETFSVLRTGIVFDGVTVLAEGFDIGEGSVLSIPVTMMNSQRWHLRLSAALTGKHSSPSYGRDECTQDVGTFALEGSINEDGALSTTKAPLSALEACSSCDDTSAQLTWRPLNTGEAAEATPPRSTQPINDKLLAAGQAGSSVIFSGVSTSAATVGLANTTANIVALKPSAALRASVHLEVS